MLFVVKFLLHAISFVEWAENYTFLNCLNSQKNVNYNIWQNYTYN